MWVDILNLARLFLNLLIFLLYVIILQLYFPLFTLIFFVMRRFSQSLLLLFIVTMRSFLVIVYFYFIILLDPFGWGTLSCELHILQLRFDNYIDLTNKYFSPYLYFQIKAIYFNSFSDNFSMQYLELYWIYMLLILFKYYFIQLKTTYL